IAIITKSVIKLNSDTAMVRDQQEPGTGILENDWTKIRDFDFQKNLKEKTKLMNRLLNFQCNICSDLAEHYRHVHAEHLLETKHERLRQFMSDQNLVLLPDYNRRIEINSADELVLTELIFENVFANYDHSEIVALLSCFIFQKRIVNEPKLIPKLEQ
ncbi:24858_t:CDS:2, partial [Gigaspora rosea]